MIGLAVWLLFSILCVLALPAFGPAAIGIGWGLVTLAVVVAQVVGGVTGGIGSVLTRFEDWLAREKDDGT